jgi:hypothetical protein
VTHRICRGENHPIENQQQYSLISGMFTLSARQLITTECKERELNFALAIKLMPTSPKWNSSVDNLRPKIFVSC